MSTASNVRHLPVAARPKVIAPYERVSALMGRDDEAFRSPDMQRTANLRNIANAGHTVYQDALDRPELYRDIDRTGRDFNREGIQRLFDLKRRGIIDGIAVLDVSRVGRTTGETLDAINLFRADDGMFLSEREHIEDTPAGEFMLTIVVGMAQMYSDNIALGWRAVLEDRFSNGLHNGQAPAGYDYVRDESGAIVKPARIELDERTAPLVREAFTRYAKGESMTTVARWLREHGVRAAKSLRPLLDNPFYLGDVRMHVYTGKAKKRVRVKDVPPLVTQGKGRHPALLVDEHGLPDRELFDRVAKRLEAERFVARRHKNPIHALGGLAVCADCGRALVVAKSSNGDYLRDHNGRQAGDCEGSGAAKPSDMEAAVLEEVRQLVQGFELGVGEQVAQLRSRETLRKERDAITSALLKLDRAETDADARHFKGELLGTRYERLCAHFAEERAQLEARLAEHELDDDGPDELSAVEAARELFARWETATPAERNVMLRACGVRKVKLRRGDRWREPVADRIEVVFSL